ncbi:hypothetical protein SMB34_00340 [Thalassospira permensis NBRC 106175]|uniref:Uncharacterized protein n=1 Tax=Thalassospira permensis NBRC 106175 TaxID=1353532 RepID=A0ABR4TTW4_9PROT|nr:hypothetical protein SMB34_00340 [Thalassospira permensis NBRC 106175]
MKLSFSALNPEIPDILILFGDIMVSNVDLSCILCWILAKPARIQKPTRNIKPF